MDAVARDDCTQHFEKFIHRKLNMLVLAGESGGGGDGSSVTASALLEHGDQQDIRPESSVNSMPIDWLVSYNWNRMMSTVRRRRAEDLALRSVDSMLAQVDAAYAGIVQRNRIAPLFTLPPRSSATKPVGN